MRKNIARYAPVVLVAVLLVCLVTACQQQGDKIAVAAVQATAPAVSNVSVDAAGNSSKTAVAQYQGSAPLPPDIARIKQRGTLIVAMYRGDRPPFFYQNPNGELTGIDVSLANDIARWLGVKPKFLRSADSFDGVVDQVADGQADIAISKLSVTLNRAQRVSFTEPYVIFQQALLVNRLKLAALEARNPGKDPLQLILNTTDKIAVRTATSYVDYAHETFPKAKIVQIDGSDGIMQKANQGKVLAAFYDDSDLKSYLHNHPDAAINLQMFVLTDRKDPIAIAVNPQSNHLLQWLNLYLEQMKGDLAIDQILQKYEGG